MLQNKFLIGQTVVVMHGKKLVEMVVDNIAPDGKKLVYELKHTTAPPKHKNPKPTGTFAEKVASDFKKHFNFGCWVGYDPACRIGARVSGANPSAIIVDDLDDKPVTEIVSFHEYKEHQIWSDLEDFKSNIQLVPLFVAKTKKKKAA